MEDQPLREVLKTNDMVAISFATALLRDAGIEHVVFDTNMSVLEGSIGILPRRVMVSDEALERARMLLKDAGLAL